jgi:hypothetical protein
LAKFSRIILDIANETAIFPDYIAEATQYRGLVREGWLG